MEIGQIVVIGLISVILGLILNKQNPEWSMYIRIAAGIIIFVVILERLGVVLDVVKE